MAENKFYTVKETINGKEYVAQFSGLSSALRGIDQSYVNDQSSNTSVEKLSNYVLEHVIVEPKGLTIDDFDDMDELNKVISFGRDVMQGKFREKANKATAKG